MRSLIRRFPVLAAAAALTVTAAACSGTQVSNTGASNTGATSGTATARRGGPGLPGLPLGG